MSSKRSVSDKKIHGMKRKRKSYGFDVKLEVIRRKRSGERVIDIARSLHMPETTIHTILSKDADIESRAKMMVRHSEVKLTRRRSDVIEIMERRLATWLEDLYQQHTPVSLALIREKALTLHKDVRKERGENATENLKDFAASKGWFHRFQKRYGLKNIKIQGEAVETDSVEFKKHVEEGQYSPKQFFHVDETGFSFYWNRMPSRTYISVKEKADAGFNSSKDLVELDELTVKEEKINKDDTMGTSKENDWNIKRLREALEKIDEAIEYFCKNDPLYDRAVKVKREVRDVVSCYHTILLGKTTKKTINP